MTSIEKRIRDFCGHHADWWPSVSQVQEMLALAQPCKTCEALAVLHQAQAEPVGRNITIRAWLDSGANIHSKYQVDFEVDEATWNSLSEDEKDEYSQNYARQRLDWGWVVKENT